MSIPGQPPPPGFAPTAHSQSIKKTNNLGIGFAKRHEERRISTAQLERGDDGKMRMRGDDGKMREVEVVSTREVESVFTKACPTLPPCLAVYCAVMNVVPGLGTLLAAYFNLCCGLDRNKKSAGQRMRDFCWQLLTSFLQTLTAPLILGFVWSLLYGFTLTRKSTDYIVSEVQKPA